MHHADPQALSTEQNGVGRQGHRSGSGRDSKVHKGILTGQQAVRLVRYINLDLECARGCIDGRGVTNDGAREGLTGESVRGDLDLLTCVNGAHISFRYGYVEPQGANGVEMEKLGVRTVAVACLDK